PPIFPILRSKKVIIKILQPPSEITRLKFRAT
ncbi:MAG: hypothetical protein ACI9MS_001820, partial [Glaciecola sp.]